MNIITQNAYQRQRMLKYLKNHTATETAIQYKISRKNLYKWKNRYDGTLESLKDRNKRPKNSPKKQTEKEIKMVKGIWSRDKNGDRLVMWHKVCKIILG